MELAEQYLHFVLAILGLLLSIPVLDIVYKKSVSFITHRTSLQLYKLKPHEVYTLEREVPIGSTPQSETKSSS